MPATLQIGQTATSSFKEWSQPNGLGVEVPAIGPVSFVSSAPAIASVDAATGLVTAMAIGAVTITTTDAGNGLHATDSVAVAAASATLVVTPN